MGYFTLGQINLIDAIKIVQNSYENFTDQQLHKFQVSVEWEIDERKAANKYNPRINIRADSANAEEKNIPSKRRGADKMEDTDAKMVEDTAKEIIPAGILKILDDHETRIKALENKVKDTE